MIRRSLLACVVSILAFPAPLVAQLTAEVVGSGFNTPVAVVPDPVFPGVFLVVEQGGIVRVGRDNQPSPAPFVDLRSTIVSGGERGLLGMAFPPDAASSGRVFFNFTDRNGDTVIARFRRSAADPLVVDLATRFDLRWPTGERVIRQPYANHNGGHLAFGPDGYLYVGLGDGGSGNDPENRAQNPASLLGKMLRIDVNVPDGDPNGYRIPPDNPFVDGVPLAALPEIWSFGLRNPWRYSFDDFGAGATGALIIGDVGQGAREEVDYEPAGQGGRNYGWRIREGTIPTPGVPPTAAAFGPLVEPIFDYGRSEGQSITGGYLYRGSRLSAAYRGRYFFADYVRSRVWSMGLSINPATGDATVAELIEHTAELGGANALGGIASFGRDLEGELYVATFAGRIIRIGPGGGGAVPGVPRDFRAVVTGTTVVLSWTAPAGGAAPLQYLLEAGTTRGASDLGTAPIGLGISSVAFANVPAGTYFLRLRAVGAGGAGAATDDVVVVVTAGGCTGRPPAPTLLAANVSGRTVTLSWLIPLRADGATAVIIEVGTGPGLSNVGVATIDGGLRSVSGAAPPGTYFVRVRARNACGTSDVSNEITVEVR